MYHNEHEATIRVRALEIIDGLCHCDPEEAALTGMSISLQQFEAITVNTNSLTALTGGNP